MSKVEQKLQEAGVKEIKYYYQNLPLIGNMYTVCALISEDKKILARGVSICSVKDSHNKKEARKRSKDRALCALFTKKSSLEINPYGKDLEKETKKSYEIFIKSFKIKNEKQKNRIMEGLENHPYISDFKIYKNDKFELINVLVPYLSPVLEASKNFKWKSEFNPEVTEEEKKIFRI